MERGEPSAAEHKEKREKEAQAKPKKEHLTQKEKYAKALEEARSVVREIEGMHEELLQGMKNTSSLDAHFAELEKRAGRDELSARDEHRARFDRFAKHAEKALELAGRSKDIANVTEAIRQAREDLDGMYDASETLDKLAHQRRHSMHRLVQREDDEMRRFARHQEEKAEHLARVARRRTDRLDDLSRETNQPDLSDDLDERAEAAIDKVRDASEEMARRIAKRAVQSEDDVDSDLQQHASARRSELHRVRSRLHEASERAYAMTSLAAVREPAVSGIAAAALVMGILAAAGLGATAAVAATGGFKSKQEWGLGRSLLA